MARAKFRILIVDDQEGLRETLGDILKDRGYEVVLAGDGYEAIRRARENTFSMVFMDIVMPGISGLDTFRQLKKISPQVTVIMMSAYSKDDLVRKALAEGAYMEVTKPFDLEKIMKIIEEIESRHSPGSQSFDTAG